MPEPTGESCFIPVQSKQTILEQVSVGNDLRIDNIRQTIIIHPRPNNESTHSSGVLVSEDIFFDLFLEEISAEYGYLESLPPIMSNEKWKKLCAYKASVKIELLKILMSYCCYFKKEDEAPLAKYRFRDKQDFYNKLAEVIGKSAVLQNVNYSKLKLIIKDHEVVAKLNFLVNSSDKLRDEFKGRDSS